MTSHLVFSVVSGALSIDRPIVLFVVFFILHERYLSCYSKEHPGYFKRCSKSQGSLFRQKRRMTTTVILSEEPKWIASSASRADYDTRKNKAN
jgi:hypothetical protein